jgi:hypothetical protein
MSYLTRNRWTKYVSDSVKNGAHILNKYYLVDAARVYARLLERERRLPHGHGSFQINAEY